HQIFHDCASKAYCERQGAKQKAWITELVAQIHKVVDRHADVAAACPAPPAFASEQMLSDDLARLRHVVEGRGRRTSLDAAGLEAGRRDVDEPSVDVLEYLLQWAGDPSGPSLFALLGEYGMGKTISCQRLVRAVEERREAEPAAWPQPLYFDLRKLTGLRG